MKVAKKHVRLNAWTIMCSLDEKITFIEGSGTTASFGYQRDFNGSVSSYMLCQHKNGVKVIGNFLFMDTCYVCTVGIPEYNSDANSVKIFPNPTLNEFNIEMKNTPINNYFLTIYNVLGEKIISQKLIERFTTINVSELQCGVYNIEIGNNFSNNHKKLIRQ